MSRSVVAVGIGHVDLHQEAVELRLGQRIGALLLDRVLRGQHVERRAERVVHARRRSPDFSCIACSSADCVRGVARLISSAIRSWQKTGPSMKRNGAAAVGRGLQHLGAQDVGRHQVGRELDPAARQAPSPCDSVSTSRVLPSPGSPISSPCPPQSSADRTRSTTRSWPDEPPWSIEALPGQLVAQRFDLGHKALVSDAIRP